MMVRKCARNIIVLSPKFNLLLVKDSRAEKPARGTLFTAVQREMGQDKILIADGMNYIKGFRYQMYCAARELKLRVCTVSCAKARMRTVLTARQVYVVATQELCKEWNSKREDGVAYAPET